MESPRESSLSSSTSPLSDTLASSSSSLSRATRVNSQNAPPVTNSDNSSEKLAAEVDTVDPLEGCSMEDVIVTDTEKNQIAQNRKKSLTKLHSINDILIAKIEVRDLKAFCTRMGIKGQGKKGKKVVCDAIAAAKVDPTFVQVEDVVAIPVVDVEGSPTTAVKTRVTVT